MILNYRRNKNAENSAKKKRKSFDLMKERIKINTVDKVFGDIHFHKDPLKGKFNTFFFINRYIL